MSEYIVEGGELEQAVELELDVVGEFFEFAGESGLLGGKLGHGFG